MQIRDLQEDDNMKVCILSMQHVPNFGSVLQAYALKKMLEQCGHTVSFLDIERREEDDQYRDGKWLWFEENRRGLLVKLKRLDRYTLNRLRVKALSQKQHSLYDDFRHEMLQMCKSANGDNFDCCVIGSDEVFNCMSESFWGFTSQLFGNVPQADRVITYAASCGATTYEDLPAAVAEKISESFQKVSAFSVRDENTKRFVAKLTEQTVLEHCDPAVVGNFDQEVAAAVLPEDLPKKYCVVYSYYNRISTPSEIKAIKSFCKKHGLEIIALGSPQMWIKKFLPLKPFECLKVFQNAEFVITDTFHGTIFSAKYAKRFATMTRPSNENKLKDLITRLHIEKHWVQSLEQLEETYQFMHDLEGTKVFIGQEHSRTMQYLTDNI